MATAWRARVPHAPAYGGVWGPSRVLTTQSASSGAQTATVAMVGAGTMGVAGQQTSAASVPMVGAGTMSVTATGAVKFVTSVSSNGRYFLDQNGSPILVRGDSPWSMLVDLSSSEIDTYLANRAAAGANLLLCSLIGCVENGGGNNNGQTYDGVLPFTSGDITTPNSTYWSRMDSYVDKAAALGITLLVYPMDGWNTKSGCVFAGKSDADCQTYGNWLATRWASKPNILWAFGGDYDASSVPGTFADSRFDACLTGIRAAGDNRPVSIQQNYMRSLSSDSSYWEARADWNFGYSYFATYDVVLAGYAKSWSGGGKPSTRPVLFSEGEYDNSPVGDGGSAAAIRRQAGWALTSGSPGAFTGQDRVWSFETGSPAWTTRINSTQTAQFKAILDTVAALAKWHQLVPDTGSALVTAGRGTPYVFSSQSDNRWNSTSDYVTAAVTPDKSLAVIYNPDTSTRSITISEAAVGANPTLRRVDPSTGTSTGMTWTTTPTASTNSAGDRDWLFIIEADPVVQSATVPMVGAGTMAVTAAVTHPAAVGMSGGGTMTVSPLVTHPATIPMVGAGQLAITAGVTEFAAVSMVGAGTMSVSGSQTILATVPMVGAGAVAVTATTSGSNDVPMVGAGTMGVTATTSGTTDVPMVGSGTLSVTAGVTHPATVPMAGTGAMSVTAAVTGLATVSMAGVGVLTVSPLVTHPAAVAMVGVGVMSVAATTSGATDIPMVGAGVLSVTGRQTILPTVPMVGAGVLGVTAVDVIAATVAMVGAGVLAVTATTGSNVIVGMVGAGTMSVTTTVLRLAGVPMAGVGLMTVAGRLSIVVAVPMVGGGTLAIVATVSGPITAVYRFTGTLMRGWSGRLG